MMNIHELIYADFHCLQTNFANSKQMPLHVYTKDLVGRYLDCNERQAYDVGLRREELIGLSDLDVELLTKECVQNFQKNDLNIIQTERPQVFLEPYYYRNKEKYLAISRKAPLVDSNKEIIGTCGFSLIIPNKDITNNTFIFANLHDFESYNLTDREKEVSKEIIKGYSSSEIGNMLNISFRTVEEHVKNIKTKLGVTKKREIIDKFVTWL